MDYERLSQIAQEHFWPNFGSRQDMQEVPLRILVSGDGAIVRDEQGREYIDCFAAIQTTMVGHGRREIADAVYAQMQRLAFYPAVLTYFTEPILELAAKLGELVPGGLSRFYFCNDGSEAVEAALKIARRTQQERGFGGRYKMISRRLAYHGVTMGALSVNGLPGIRRGFDPGVPGVSFAPPPYCYRCEMGLDCASCGLECYRAIERIVEFEGPDTVAAIILEPVMGAATGFAAPPAGYLAKLRELCDRTGILLIFDEVSAGFGRTGKWFSCENYGVYPDIMTMAKGLTSGYLPLGAVAVRPEIGDLFYGPKASADFVHGHSMGGHTASCAAALAAIAIMQNEGLVERAAAMGRYMLAALKPLERHPIVGEVRGTGMGFGIEIVKDKATKENLPANLGVTRRIRLRAWDLGLICRNETDLVVLCPPLVLTEEQADRTAAILDQCLSEVEADLGL
jgi:adenosylmethionine-8-amino-7-oxononanoate aminotransferase